jgi:ATP-dependent DNA helicase RecQ
LFRQLERGGCRHQSLVGYFDEAIAPCGTSCDSCLGVTLDEVFVRQPARSTRGSMAQPSLRTPSWLQPTDAPVDTDLFERLRVLRRRLADAEGKPAYIIFSDAVLREMAQKRPTSEAALLRVSGVGVAKLERYGKAFLELLRGNEDG